jgi:hypothetical protein
MQMQNVAGVSLKPIFFTEVNREAFTYFFINFISVPFNSLHMESNSGLLGDTRVL